jgi:hypothetical protein
MGLAIVGLAVLGSISIAVVVEWIALWGLMQMMPAPEPVVAPVAASAGAPGENASNLRTEFHTTERAVARAAAR